MDNILEAFQYGFFLRAFGVGLILAVIYALLGNYVVLRKEAIIGHTMANLIFMGIAIALLFSFNLPLIMTLAAIVGVFFIGYLEQSSRFSRDSVLALTGQISMAAAIVTLSQVSGYQNIEGFLFGNILAISKTDVWMTLGLLAINLIVLYRIRRPLTQLVINPELAISAGTKVNRINFIFMLLLALTVAAGVKIIGVILLSAFLVMPANSAKSLAKNFGQMQWISMVIGLIGVTLGLFLAYILDTPSGAMIVLVLGVILILSTLLGQFLRNRL